MELEEIRKNPKVTECVLQMQEYWRKLDEAAKLKEEAEEIKEQVGQEFSDLKSDYLKKLEEEETRLEYEYECLVDEERDLAKRFCELRGKHEIRSCSWQASYTPLYHSFTRGDVYPTKSYSECIICGYHYGSFGFNRQISYTYEEKRAVIKAYTEANENPELEDVAKKLFEMPSKKEEVSRKKEEMHKQFCEIFGHVVEDAGFSEFWNAREYKCLVCREFLVEYRNNVWGSKLYDIIQSRKK